MHNMMNIASVAAMFWTASFSQTQTCVTAFHASSIIGAHRVMPSMVVRHYSNLPDDPTPSSDIDAGSTPLEPPHVQDTASTPELSQETMTGVDVVKQCMDALLQNDVGYENSGLEVCFDFSSDRCRAALGGSLEEFLLHASNPTFGSMINANTYEILNVGSVIGASMTRGAMQTVLIKVSPSKGDDRTFLW